MAKEDNGNKAGFKDKLAAWMEGRNGSDELGVSILMVALLLLIINLFVRSFVLSIFALLLIGYCCWRLSSRDVEARETENVVFLDFVAPIMPWFRNPGSAAKELREYKHLTCPECGQRVRVPRKKGKLRITCPSCHAKFEAKS
ncbi:MAG: zinc ribbon domain-containing protein [Atopobiaceae bacterium]|nr:zinc ribbon domain-containing protein [Atopobiaceae bacterium]MBR3313410.1 zinc ribbon domain-containing protein [Atopobiaceae bacterium]